MLQLRPVLHMPIALLIQDYIELDLLACACVVYAVTINLEKRSVYGIGEQESVPVSICQATHPRLVSSVNQGGSKLQSEFIVKNCVPSPQVIQSAAMHCNSSTSSKRNPWLLKRGAPSSSFLSMSVTLSSLACYLGIPAIVHTGIAFRI